VKVADTSHESRGRKISQHVKMFATKSITSPWQTYYNAWGNSATKSVDFVADTNHESPWHKSWKSATWFVSRT